MESHRVELHAWYDINKAGGRAHPYGDPINYWTISKIHAQYESPEIPAGSVDSHGRELKRRFMMRAYLVDLDGSAALGLDDLDRVMLHQVPPVGHWWIKRVDDAYLERIEPLRVESFESGR